MPYIDPDRRARIDNNIQVVAPAIGTIGELNYAITTLLEAVITQQGRFDEHYSAYNDAIGVLECIKLEFYRRLVAPYEEKKMLENGDVFRYTEETKERNKPQ